MSIPRPNRKSFGRALEKLCNNQKSLVSVSEFDGVQIFQKFLGIFSVNYSFKAVILREKNIFHVCPPLRVHCSSVLVSVSFYYVE